jgi:hypothetical protein
MFHVRTVGPSSTLKLPHKILAREFEKNLDEIPENYDDDDETCTRMNQSLPVTPRYALPNQKLTKNHSCRRTRPRAGTVVNTKPVSYIQR